MSLLLVPKILHFRHLATTGLTQCHRWTQMKFESEKINLSRVSKHALRILIFFLILELMAYNLPARQHSQFSSSTPNQLCYLACRLYAPFSRISKQLLESLKHIHSLWKGRVFETSSNLGRTVEIWLINKYLFSKNLRILF